MFNRRFLRIKVLQALYALLQDEQTSVALHEKTMLKSLDNAFQVYIFLLSLPSAFRHYLEQELDMQQSKYFPDGETIAPLKALLNNQCILLLEKSEAINGKMKSLKLHWVNSNDLFKNSWNDLLKNEAFVKYAASEKHQFAEDRKLLAEIYQIFIGESEIFEQYMEERFINWDDDQVLVTNALLKTISQLGNQTFDTDLLLNAEAPTEDIEFMKLLFRKTIEQSDELTALIGGKTQNWETDRIAMVDMLLMKMALCEILHFPHIPVKVSINEYLEVAKLYSTPYSHGFINGVLDKVQIDLRKQNKIIKQGRGLVE
jgi:transcription antitermination protein NusB